MNTLALIINIGIGIMALIAISFMAKDMMVHKEQFKAEMKVGGTMKSIKASGIAIVTLFMDTIGIGCYAPMTACFKILKVTRDKYIPGTLNVACIMATAVESVYFISSIEMDVMTLVVCIACATIGAYVGGGIVSKLDLNKIRKVMGVALLVVVVVLIAGIMGWLSFGGDALGLTGWKLIAIAVVALVMGALMTVGVGIYAPLLAMVTLLGMDPIVAYPVMTGCCAYLIPAAAVRFCQESIKSEKPLYDRKVAILTNTVGLIGPAIAMIFVVSLPLFWLKILVIIVITYTGSFMLYQGITKAADKLAEAEDAELAAIGEE